MKYTLKDLSKLKEAYATGAKVVRFGDKLIEYRDKNAIAQIISELEVELGLKKEEKKITVFQPSYNKDLL